MYEFYNLPNVALDEQSVATCPSCGGNNLHHAKTVVYHRLREDGEAVKTEVHMEGVNRVLVPDAAVNSPRRDGVMIEFWCENCHAVDADDPPRKMCMIELHIIQHKGCTYIKWKVPPIFFMPVGFP